jgi:hypothetical protein
MSVSSWDFRNFATIFGTSTAITEWGSQVASPTGKSRHATNNGEIAPRDQQLVKHLLFIVARVEYPRHYVELMVVMLGDLGQIRSDIEFLVVIESQACCMCGLELLREQIFNDE